LFVPRGFAHGYCTLCDDVMLAYKVDGDYAPQAEGGVVWNDPALAIDWPIDADAAILSDKDRVLPRLSNLPDPAF
jgi:dTDP-4-dehydrorhamnose 3,5-epimerase